MATRSLQIGGSPRGRWLSGAIALLLLAAVVFQFAYRLRARPEPEAHLRIAEILPRTVLGWYVREEPIGQTEAASDAALKTLNLDDHVYRRFEKGTIAFTIYAAYWGPGKMPTRLVASHTPDRCWTENGMRCVETAFKQQYTVEEKALLPAEYRVFTPATSNQRTYVAYWHTVEGKLYDYGSRFNAVPHPFLWWKDTVAQAAYGSREQLFVRIASQTPLQELWQNADFQRVMATAASLGLWAEIAPKG